MSDLVKRLRDYEVADMGHHSTLELEKLLKDAADRIEHLESVVGAVSSGKDWLLIRKEAGREEKQREVMQSHTRRDSETVAPGFDPSGLYSKEPRDG